MKTFLLLLILTISAYVLGYEKGRSTGEAETAQKRATPAFAAHANLVTPTPAPVEATAPFKWIPHTSLDEPAQRTRFGR